MSNQKLTRAQMIDALMDYQQKSVADAILEGEHPSCFDLPGARLYYESLSDKELELEIEELDDAMTY